MNWRLLITVHLIVGLLLASWFFPPTLAIWTFLDYKVFYFLNSWIETSFFWQHFWAIASYHQLDWFHDLIMLFFFSFYFVNAPKGEGAKRVANIIFCILVVGFVIYFLNKNFFPNVLDYHRDSPTVVCEDAVRLTHKVDWLRFKDKSHRSYPGDHGTTALAFTFGVYFFQGRKMGILATLYAVFFCLPRLIAGAHWLTDILMGSLPVAFLTLAWTVGTPLLRIGSEKIENLIKKYKLHQV